MKMNQPQTQSQSLNQPHTPNQPHTKPQPHLKPSLLTALLTLICLLSLATATYATAPPCSCDVPCTSSWDSGAFDDSAEGMAGAEWRLYTCGELVVGGGYIDTETSSPLRYNINDTARIRFTAPITCGENLSYLFWSLLYVTEIEGLEFFDTSKVTNMQEMFRGMNALTALDVSSWDTSNVTNMSEMFRNMNALTTLNVSNWNTSKVEYMSGMFADLGNLTVLDLSGFDTSNVTDMSGMFYFASALTELDLSGFDTSKVTDMSRMFEDAYGLTSLNVSTWDTGSVTDMLCMFFGAYGLTALDLSGWDTSNVMYMEIMFRGASGLTTLDLSGWDTSSVMDMTGLFHGTTSLKSITFGENFKSVGDYVQYSTHALPTVSPENGNGWRTAGNLDTLTSEDLWEYLRTNTRTAPMQFVWANDFCDDCEKFPCVCTCPYCGAALSVDGKFDDSLDGMKGAEWWLYDCGELVVGGGYINNPYDLDTPYDPYDLDNPWNSPWYDHRDNITHIAFTAPITGGTYLTSLFSRLYRVTKIEGLAFFNTSSVTDMSEMFSYTSALTTLDVSTWDTSKVTNMHSMFHLADSLTSLDLSAWDTSSVTNMANMFIDMGNLTAIDVSAWNTSKVTNMSGMFGMFVHASSKLTALDLSGWDTSNVTTMQSMFWYMNGLIALDLSAWDTSKVENMSRMFEGANGLTSLNVSTWDTSSVTDMSFMFINASGLTTLDLSGWDTSNVLDMNRLFHRATSLKSITFGENFKTIGDYAQSSTYAIPPVSPENGGGWRTASSPNTLTSEDLWEYLRTNDTRTAPMQFVWANDFCDECEKFPCECCDICEKYPCECCPYCGAAFSVGGKLGDSLDGMKGAEWRLYNCGKLVVGGGYINNTTNNSPWNGRRDNITHIRFTAPITAGTRLSSLFSGLYRVTEIEGLALFNTSNVTTMYGMFWGTLSLTTLDVSTWDTSSVEDMSSMFENAIGLTTLDLSGWDTSNVTDMRGMFYGASDLTTLDLSGWDTSSVEDMEALFRGTSSLTALDLSAWDTSSVTYMRGMFNASGLTALDLSGWDTSSVTNMAAMFENASGLTTLDLSGWDTSSATGMTGMFNGASSLKSITFGENFKTVVAYVSLGVTALPSVSPENGNGWRTANNPNTLTSEQLWQYLHTNDTRTAAMQFVWANDFCDECEKFPCECCDICEKYPCECPCPYCGAAFSVGGKFDDSLDGMKGAEWRLYNCGDLVVGGGYIHLADDGTNSSPWTAHLLDVHRIIFTAPITAGERLASLFRSLAYVTEIEGLELFDTSNVTKMNSMFEGAKSLTALDLSAWDTSKVTDMYAMFSVAESLTALDLSAWDTSSVTSMNSMFNCTFKLADLDLSGWNTSKVTTMGAMFNYAEALTDLDLSGFDTSNVTSMYLMFDGASGLTSLDVSGWDTSKVTDMGNMFRGASSLTSLDLSSWDTRKVEFMFMFEGADLLSSITFGKDFITIGDYEYYPLYALPPVSPENGGGWTTEGKPEILTSAELWEYMRTNDTRNAAERWVWAASICDVCEKDPCECEGADSGLEITFTATTGGLGYVVTITVKNISAEPIGDTSIVVFEERTAPAAMGAVTTLPSAMGVIYDISGLAVGEEREFVGSFSGRVRVELFDEGWRWGFGGWD